MSLTRGQEARAWVNFNGTGTVAIRDSFNVSSITDNGTGDYTINFDQAMPNANYTTVIGSVAYMERVIASTTTDVNITTFTGTPAASDYNYIGVAIFGDPS